MSKTPPYLTTALALARAAKAANLPRLAAWGNRLEAAIEQAQDDQDPTVKCKFPFVKTGD